MSRHRSIESTRAPFALVKPPRVAQNALSTKCSAQRPPSLGSSATCSKSLHPNISRASSRGLSSHQRSPTQSTLVGGSKSPRSNISRTSTSRLSSSSRTQPPSRGRTQPPSRGHTQPPLVVARSPLLVGSPYQRLHLAMLLGQIVRLPLQAVLDLVVLRPTRVTSPSAKWKGQTNKQTPRSLDFTRPVGSRFFRRQS